MSKINGKIKTLVHNVANNLGVFIKIEEAFISQSKCLGLKLDGFKYSLTIEYDGESYTNNGSVSGLINHPDIK